jgi:ElaA protein
VVNAARTSEIDASTLYALLRLRAEVFVVEQASAYLDPDGRDVEPGTVQLWITDETSDQVVATARVLEEPDGSKRIGRVCTAAPARGRGLAAQLVRAALTQCGGASVIIDAQSHLTDWYAQFGFMTTGREFVDDDGIPHTEMVRR